MIVLLKSSKTLDFSLPAETSRHTVPQFLNDAAFLVGRLRTLSEYVQLYHPEPF
jgi:cytoplasmic iron level regulating protein YaaA (DUF328/UPF0246 family)